MSLLQPLSLRSLRVQLTLWFGGLLLITMAVVALYVGHIASKEVMRTAGETISISTRASAELLATNLSEREREIELLRQTLSQEDRDFSSNEARVMLDRIRANEAGYAWIGLADRQGKIVQATEGMLVGQNARERPWFKHAQDGLFIGDLHLAVLLAKLLPDVSNDQPLRFIDIAVPVKNDEGQVEGILAAHLHWTWITDIIKTLMDHDKLLKNAELLIIDNEGSILYPESLVGALKLPQTLSMSQHYQALTWPDGSTYLSSLAAVGPSTNIDLGWRVIVRQPIGATSQSIKALQRELALLGLLAFLVFMLIAYRISQRLTRPIESLVQIARQIESKPSAVKFPKDPGSPELASLSSAFDSMTRSLLSREEELATLNANLESQVANRTEQLRHANEQLQVLATTDSLTGLLNRRQFEKSLHEHHQRSLRTGIPYCILMLDVDLFKSVNDQFGHQAGDLVLQTLGQLLRQTTRATDVCARFGGEEFIVLVPDRNSPSEGVDLGEKIRSAVEQIQIAQVGQITLSIGVSESNVNDVSPEAVVSRADAALYQAKAQGRNRVVSIS